MCRRLIYLVSFILVMFAVPLVTHAQVDDVITVPGEIVNILANGGFEDGVPDPWSTYGDVTTEVVQELVGAVVPEAPIEGDSCLHVVVAAAGANFWDAGLQHAGHVFEAGKKYTLSAFLKSKEGTLDINFKPELGADPWSGYGDQVFTMTEEWTEFSVTTPVFAEDTSPGSITFHIAFAAGDFWIDGARWYEGDYVPPGATITVEAGGDIAAANSIAKASDTIEIAEGTFYLTSQIEIKDGVTYKGAGAGLTIIDGNDTTRAFVAWGERSFNEGNENPNDSGPKGWVLEGMTIQNCVADTNNRFSYTSAAFNLKTNFATLDVDASGGLNPDEADGEVGGIRLAGADGTEGTEDDDLHRFVHIDTDGSGEISEAELDAQILVQEDEFGDEDGDGGAIFIGNAAVGTIANCDFLNNHTPIPGDGDDGGAVNITGLSVVTINDCLFNGNYACSPTGVSESDETGDADGDAGHIKVQGGSASAITPGTTLIANRCVFLNGNAEDDSGAIQSSAVGSIIRLDACWFEGNTAADDGTVLFIGNESSGELTVTNCVFANNISTAASDRMCQVRRNSKFINCTFVGNNQDDQDMIYNNANAADTDADGVDDELADATQVINCIFANNVVGDGDDVLGSRNDAFTIAATNCIFFGNTLQNGSAADNTQRPDVETGSILTDPLLDAGYVPAEGSPAIDAGVDPAIVGVTLTTDYNGDSRPQGAAYDIGAYESPPQPVDPGSEGLVAYYALDNDANDSSGNNLNGTLVGDPNFVEGVAGMALDFDGVGDYVDCGTNEVLNNLSDAITVSAWVSIRSVTTEWMGIVMKGETAWRLGVNSYTTGVHWGFTGSARGWQAANSVTELPLDEWHHIAGTCEKNVGAIVYVDGVAETENPDLDGVATNEMPLLLGENPESTGRFYDGLLDEVMIYNRALSDGEIMYLAGNR